MSRKTLVLIVLLALPLWGCAGQPTYAPKDRVSLEQARGAVLTWLLGQSPDFNAGVVLSLQETDLGLDGLYERTGLQFFSLEGSTWLFSLYGGKANGLQHTGLQGAALSDVDGDGNQEAVLLMDAGSGRYIAKLAVADGNTLLTKVVENSGSALGYRLEGRGDLLRLTKNPPEGKRETFTVRVRGGELEIVPETK